MRRIVYVILFLWFVTYNVYGDIVTQNIDGGCNTNVLSVLENTARLVAQFVPNSYNCAAGYYLPADTLGCVQCLSGYHCPGGIYEYNYYINQGLLYSNLIHENVFHGCKIDFLFPQNGSTNLVASFTPNQYTCNPGYYLPANYEDCVLCPQNSYCPGGVYTFNEIVTQGIMSCANGLQSPTGMWESAQCGRILHIGENIVYLRSTKKTQHAMHFDMDNDGVADYFANMTTANVPIHIGTAQKIKVELNGQIYFVCDDTITIPE